MGIEISVIINCFNGERFIKKAIDSVLAQTFKNFELIIWDNQSTDGTASVVKNYWDDRIRYFYAPEHTSLGKARNYAIEKACGKYVSFLDVDDTWEIGFLQTYANYLKEYTDIGLAYSCFMMNNGEKQWYSSNTKSSCIIDLKWFLRRYDVGMSSVLVCKNIIDKYAIRFDDRFSLIEDFDFFVRIGLKSKILYIPESLMTYNLHQNNLSHSKNWCDELSLLCNLIESKAVGYEDMYPYSKYVTVRKNHYEIIQSIKDGEKNKALRLILKTSFIDITILKLLLSVIFGGNTMQWIKSHMNKNH